MFIPLRLRLGRHRRHGALFTGVAALALLLVLATALALPQLHEVYHGTGASESNCPVHQLQIGCALVLLVLGALLAPWSAARTFVRPRLAVAAPRTARRSPWTARGPPVHSSLSR